MQLLPGGQAVKHVHHAAVGYQHDVFAGMAGGNVVHRGLYTCQQLGRGFTAGRGEVRVALFPAAGLVGPLFCNVGPSFTLKGAEAALAQAGVQLHFACARVGSVSGNGLRGAVGAL